MRMKHLVGPRPPATISIILTGTSYGKIRVNSEGTVVGGLVSPQKCTHGLMPGSCEHYLIWENMGLS